MGEQGPEADGSKQAKASKQSRQGNGKHMRLVVARLGKKPISGDKEHGTQVSGAGARMEMG